MKFANHAEAKAAGYFSRRHVSGQEHFASRDLGPKSKERKRKEAAERQAAYDRLSLDQRIAAQAHLHDVGVDTAIDVFAAIIERGGKPTGPKQLRKLLALKAKAA